MKKIAYLGPEGTFSQKAAKLYIKREGINADLIAFPTFHDVLYAVDREEVDEAIVPVENSTEGTIGVVQDMLVKEVDLKINGEIVLAVHNCLLAKKDIPLKEIEEVISHTQPLEHCRGWIRKHLPHAKITPASSTADAAKRAAASSNEKICTIGSDELADIYGLKILVKDVNDYKDNVTRFIILAKSDAKPTGSDKTSIVFSAIADKPGGLYAILGEFSQKGINLTKIESRPSKKALGDYFFFVDIEGHRKDKNITQALSDIVNKVSFLKVLGSYPKGGK